MAHSAAGPPLSIKIGYAVTFVAVLVMIFFTKATKPEHVAAPKKFSAFVAKDKSFRCESPDGWASAYKGSHGLSSQARFERGPAKIIIMSDLSGSLWGDIARAGAASEDSMGSGRQRAPVDSVHEMGSYMLRSEFEQYDETRAKPIGSTVGEARISEFSAEGDFRTGKVKGYRVTMLGGERSVSVFCIAPEHDWDSLKPAFQRVIKSVAPASEDS